MKWITANPIKAALFVGVLAVIGFASWAEMAGYFDQPCAQSDRAAEGESEAPGFALSVTKQGATYHYRPEPDQQCEEPDWWNIPFEGWVALSTVLLFISTTGLWIATRQLGDRADRGMRTLERAYVWAGIPNEMEPQGGSNTTRIFLLGNNAGKTPAIVKKFYLRVITKAEFESLGTEPVYPPDTSENKFTTVADHIIPSGEPQRLQRMVLHHRRWVIYGYIEYLDIWGDSHTSRFCVELWGELLNPPVPRVHSEVIGAPAWNAWD